MLTDADDADARRGVFDVQLEGVGCCLAFGHGFSAHVEDFHGSPGFGSGNVKRGGYERRPYGDVATGGDVEDSVGFGTD